MAGSIYRSAAGRAEILDLYDRAVDALDRPVDDVEIETRFGSTHVLVGGPAEGPPLVVFHGGNALNPLSLAWFGPLMERWRVYAPDTVGHPGKSAEARLANRDDDFGAWAVDVLDGLGLDRPAMAGVSFGAGIVLRAAAREPARVGRAALVVPAGLVEPRRLTLLFRLALPALAFRLAPSRERLEAVVDPLFSEPPPPLWLETIGAVLRHVRVETELPAPVSRAELERFRSPALVVAAEDDLLFPGRAVLERARAVVPNLAGAELLRGSRHVPPHRDRVATVDRLRRFLFREG